MREMALALLDVVRHIPFEIYKVTTGFNPTSVLSRVDLNLETYKDELDRSVVIRAGELERLEAKPENQEVFNFIKNSRSRAWPPSSKHLSEHSVLLEISQRILVPLCRADEVILEISYSTLVSKLRPGAAELKTGYIGLGSWKTWHGTPDAWVRLYAGK